MTRSVAITMIARRSAHYGSKYWYGNLESGKGDALLWSGDVDVGFSEFNQAMAALFPDDLEPGQERRYVLTLTLDPPKA